MNEKDTAQSPVLDLFRLEGLVAILVGGSRGLGKSIALGFAQAGAITIICSRQQDTCSETAEEIQSQTGQESVGMALDATREDQVEAVFDRVVEQYGKVDILLNSAGINARYPIEDCPPDVFRNLIEINLTGSWLCCRAAVRHMKPRQSGSIINVGSALSTVALPERTPYCASKFGIIGVTQALALELAPFGVRCNAICPGAFLTEMNLPLLKEPERAKAVVSQMAVNRWGELHEIRGAALFLASDASTFVTGSSLYVDGGWTAR